MKKKIITLAMAAVMTFAFSITAVAAPSATATANDGTPVAVVSETEDIFVDAKTVEELAAELEATNERIKNQNPEQYAINKKAIENLPKKDEVLAAAAKQFNYTVENTVLIDLWSMGPWDGSAIKISVAGLGVKKGDKVLVNHLSLATGEWESFLADAVDDDEIVMNGIYDFSPFQISKISGKGVSNAAAAAAVSSASTASSTATSPKTGFSVVEAIVDLF